MPRVIFIAEIGINHKGNMDMAKRMIDEAKNAGADIAKFQWYDPDKVLGQGNPHLAEAKAAQFTVEQHLELKEYCHQAGIEWCVSAFHIEQVPILDKAGMRRFKVASRAAQDRHFLRTIAATKKPVLLSTGLCQTKDLNVISTIFPRTYPVTFLYCVCEYPAPADIFNFDRMEDLRRHSMNVGFSSHCADIAPALEAISRGASVVEQHVVLDKNQAGCDVSSSLTFDQFALLVQKGKKTSDAVECIQLVEINTPEQIEWLRVQRNRPELYRYFRQDSPISQTQQIKWWRTLNKSAVRLFLVEHKKHGRIGYVGFNPYSPGAGRAEFGGFILPIFQGNGYGSTALKMLFKYGFEECHLSTIYSDVIDYPGEHRFDFYGKLGFKAFPPEHQFIRYKKQDRMVPSIRFFMTREMWEGNHDGKNKNGGLELDAAPSSLGSSTPQNKSECKSFYSSADDIDAVAGKNL